jgi:plasmid stabilization system protein ParE
MRTIDSGADSLEAFPELGRPMGDDTGRRELFVPFGAGAYVLRYRIHHNTAVIIRAWHSREERA